MLETMDTTSGVHQDDPETALMALLIDASEYRDEVEISSSSCSVVSWLWSRLVDAPSNDETNNGAAKQHTKTSWEQSTVQQIGKLLLQLNNPFEVHHMASTQVPAQMLFGITTTFSFKCLLVLLCVWSLRQYESKGRPKRWRSLACETIRLYQESILSTQPELELWIDYVLPSSLQVYQRLLCEEVDVLSLVAGIVGTMTSLVVKIDDLDTMRVEQFLKQLESIFGIDRLLWFHPWRVAAAYPTSNNEETEYLMNKDNLVWWTMTGAVSRAEYAADMNTSWDSLGIALLASFAFEPNNGVWTHTHFFNMWFPHVDPLLLNKQGTTRETGLIILNNILQCIPPHVLDDDSSKKEQPNNPVGTLQLLSNYIMSLASTKGKHTSQETTRATECMKQLVSKYTPPCQVSLVKEVVDTCPHAGFIPRILDLLRPLVVMAAKTGEPHLHDLYKYLSGWIDKLVSELDNVDSPLEQNIESYVSVLTMIYLWIKVGGTTESIPCDDKRLHEKLRTCLEQLNTRIHQDQQSEEHFRFNLLQDALEQLVSLLDPSNKELKRTSQASHA